MLTLIPNANPVLFVEWLISCAPGDRCAYHRGILLMADGTALQVKQAAWRAAVAGRVYLTQHRTIAGVWTYYAQRAHAYRPAYIPRDYLTYQESHT